MALFAHPFQSNQLMVYSVLAEPIVQKAMLFYLKNARTVPSHNFYHTFRTFDLALSHAPYAEMHGLFPRQEAIKLALACVFHDYSRTAKAISDPKGVLASVKAMEEFCRTNRLSWAEWSSKTKMEQDIRDIAYATNPVRGKGNTRSETICELLNFGDTLHFIDPLRLMSFIVENPKLAKMTASEIEEIYVKKFLEKFSGLKWPINKTRLHALAAEASQALHCERLHTEPEFLVRKIVHSLDLIEALSKKPENFEAVQEIRNTMLRAFHDYALTRTNNSTLEYVAKLMRKTNPRFARAVLGYRKKEPQGRNVKFFGPTSYEAMSRPYWYPEVAPAQGEQTMLKQRILAQPKKRMSQTVMNKPRTQRKGKR